MKKGVIVPAWGFQIKAEQTTEPGFHIRLGGSPTPCPEYGAEKQSQDGEVGGDHKTRDTFGEVSQI